MYFVAIYKDNIQKAVFNTVVNWLVFIAMVKIIPKKIPSI